MDAARQRIGLPASNVTYLAEDPSRDPVRITEKSSRDGIGRVLADLATRAGPNDVIFILLIGHGAVRGDETLFNLPGPDLSGAGLDSLLAAFPTQRIVVVNTAPASGGFVQALSGPNRTVVTATKSKFEENDAVFGGFFVAAFAEDVADTDKDDRVSILEAFDYARREVARVYDDDNRLLTEHALLDDNGDGEGSTEPDAQESDGALARRTFLTAGAVAMGGAAEGSDDPVLATLLQAKADLEARIERLRQRKDQMDPQAYENALEELVVELAQKDREIRQRTGSRE
jgi:hypothetical protein